MLKLTKEQNLLYKQDIDDAKKRQNDQLNELVKEHENDLATLLKTQNNELKSLNKEKSNAFSKGFNSLEEKKAYDRVFEEKYKRLFQKHKDEKDQLLKKHEKKVEEAKKRHKEEIKALNEKYLELSQKNKKDKGKDDSNWIELDEEISKGRGGGKNNNSKVSESFWEYHIILLEDNSSKTEGLCEWINFIDGGAHAKSAHGTVAYKTARIYIHYKENGKSTWYMVQEGYQPLLWQLDQEGVMTYGYYETNENGEILLYTNTSRGKEILTPYKTIKKEMANISYLRKVAVILKSFSNHNIRLKSKKPISDFVKEINSWNISDTGWCTYDRTASLTILSRRFYDDSSPNRDIDDKNKENRKKLYWFKYNIVIHYDDGTQLKIPERRLLKHEKEILLPLRKNYILSCSWHEHIVNYTRKKDSKDKIIYEKRSYVKESPIATRTSLEHFPGIPQITDVTIDKKSIRKTGVEYYDKIVDMDFIEILPFTTKLMVKGKAILGSKVWENLISQISHNPWAKFLIEQNQTVDIVDITRKLGLSYIENISTAQDEDLFQELKEDTTDPDDLYEILKDQGKMYNAIVEANNNILQIPNRLNDDQRQVFSIPLNIFYNLEIESDHEVVKFLSDLQKASSQVQKQILEWITDTIINAMKGVNLDDEFEIKPFQVEDSFLTKPIIEGKVIKNEELTASMQLSAIETIAKGTITTIAGEWISGQLLTLMAQQVVSLIAEFFVLKGLDLTKVWASQVILSGIKQLVFVLGEALGKSVGRIISWLFVAMTDILIVSSAVLITLAIKKAMEIKLSDYAFILGINYGSPPDIHFFGLSQLGEQESHQQLIDASKQFRENTDNKKYDRVIGYAIAKDLKTQPITKKEIGAVIDLTDDKNPQVVSGKELKLLYALQFMYLFENVDEMQIPDRACVPLPPPIPSTSPSPSPSPSPNPFPNPNDLINPQPKPFPS